MVFSSHRVRMLELDHKEGWAPKNWCFRTVVLEKTLESPWQRSSQSILKEINPEYSLEGLLLSWSSNTLATWCKEPTHWKRPWCQERLKAGGEGDNRGQDGWRTSPTQWIWVSEGSGRWWRTGNPGMLQSLGSQLNNSNNPFGAKGYLPTCQKTPFTDIKGDKE